MNNPTPPVFPDMETASENLPLKTDGATGPEDAISPNATSEATPARKRRSSRQKTAGENTLQQEETKPRSPQKDNTETVASPEDGRDTGKKSRSRRKSESTDLAGKKESAPKTPAASRRKSARKSSPMEDTGENASNMSDMVGEHIAVTVEQKAGIPAMSPLPEEETAQKKNRRGKRGGKKKNGKNESAPAQQQTGAPIDPLATAYALLQIPALPPAAESPETGRAASSRRNKQPRTEQKPAGREPLSRKRMFISVIPGEQIEVGIADDGVLLEYYLDMLHHKKLKGNIYKGIIHNIDSNLQAAFIDFGVGKNGFLQIDEVHPEYWQDWHGETGETKRFPPIQKVLRPGQEVLVQVVKEPSGNKGAFLTTWLSLAGRFLVLTPGQEQIGVSRKVTDPEERSRLREMMNGIDPGAGLGVIVRTVGEGATKTTLKTDLQYLKRLWKEIRKKATELSAPALLHQEPGLSERSVRDYLTDDVNEIWVDNESEAISVRGMASLLFPRKKDLVHIYDNPTVSLWDNFKLRRQLEQIYSREVALPSGGRLVFDQTEALMAIDINSGKISGKGNFETMAFKTNMEASQAIARQLRLRDVGGQVVIDFIEMREKKHVLEVEKSLRQAMKSDRARHDVARMSAFGLLELVRQRMGSSALSISMETCAACGGTGLTRNLEWQALQTLRDLRQKMQNSAGDKYICEYPRELGLYLLNFKRDALRDLEEACNKILEIKIRI